MEVNKLNREELLKMAQSLIERENFCGAIHLIEAGVCERVITPEDVLKYGLLKRLISKNAGKEITSLLQKLKTKSDKQTSEKIDILLSEYYIKIGAIKKAITILEKLKKDSTLVIKEYSRVFFAIKEYDKAEELLSQYIINNSDDHEAAKLYALTLMYQGTYTKAASILEEIIHNNPEEKHALILLAKCYRKLGRIKEAKDMLTKFLSSFYCPIAVLEMGFVERNCANKNANELVKKALENGILPAVDDYWETIEILAPEHLLIKDLIDKLSKLECHEYACLLKGMYAEIQGNIPDAFKYYYSLMRKKNEWIKTLACFYIGRLHLKVGEIAKALNYLKRAVTCREADVEVLNTYGVALAYSNDLKNAMELYKKALSINPTYKYALVNYARALSRDRNDVVALEYVDKALENDPMFIPAHKLKIKILENLKMYNEAIEKINELIEIYPSQFYEYMLLKAKCYEKLLLYENAIETLKKIIEKCGEDPHVLYKLALLYEKINDLKCAEKYYESLLKRQPTHKRGLYRMGLVLAAKKKYNRAIEVLNKLLTLEPENVEGLNALALVYMHSQNYTSALKVIDKAISLDWEYAQSWYNRMKILKKIDAEKRIKEITRELFNRYREYDGTEPLWPNELNTDDE